MTNPPGILFQDASLLALDKPSGMLSVPDRFNTSKISMMHIAQQIHPDARPLHRLDFETSGVLLFCTDPNAFGWYSDQFEQRTVSKSYLAICEGRFASDQGEIDAPLFTRTTGKVIISRQGRPSLTQWKVEERFTHHTLIEARPLTGRTHQIRVHLASVNHPVVGDVTYGSTGPLFLSALKGKKRYKLSKDVEEERPLLQRVALHASSLVISAFTSAQPLDIHSPLAKDMAVALAKLRQYSALS